MSSSLLNDVTSDTGATQPPQQQNQLQLPLELPAAAVGIDVNQALQILSERSRCAHQQQHVQHYHDAAAATTSQHYVSSDRGLHPDAASFTSASTIGSSCATSCSNGHEQNIPSLVKSMGQTLFLHADPDQEDLKPVAGAYSSSAEGVNHNIVRSSSQECAGVESGHFSNPTLLPAREPSQHVHQQERTAAIQSQLQSMTWPELIQAVLQAQRERVAAYREYDQGLEWVLQSGNWSLYPALCARATASFAVLSDTIQQSMSLMRPKRAAVAKQIAQLQIHEREKLHLTAALHLERIRIGMAEATLNSANNTTTAITVEQNNNNNNHNMDIDDDEVMETQQQLLREGVESLRGNIAIRMEAINDILEEIRMELIEEEE